jgi:hypothetical protein
VLKKGEKVIELTKKVGQHSRTGVVEAARGESVEVRWDDGHLSIVSRTALAPITKANEASAHQG